MSKKLPTIGVLIGYQVYSEGTLDPFLSPILRGFLGAAVDHGCHLLISCGVSQYTPHPPSRPAWPVFAEGVDFIPVGPWNTEGLIIVLPIESKDRTHDVRQLVARGHPVVFVNRGAGAPAVVVDNKGGIQQAMSHLMAHGHQRIAFIAGQSSDPGDSALRLQAYRDFLDRHNLPYAPALVTHGEHNYADGKRAMASILESGKPFTAVLGSNDKSVMGAMEVLQTAGYRVPEDIAVIGFDDQMEARIQTPPLTTVRYPLFESGWQAVDLLLARIKGQATANDTLVKLPTRLIIRRSCGCRPGIRPGYDKTSQTADADNELISPIVQRMAAEVLTEAALTSPADVYNTCHRLVTAFVASLQEKPSPPFFTTLDEIIQQTEENNGPLYAWQESLSTLANHLPTLLEAACPAASREQALQMLNQAQAAIGEGLQRQHIQCAIHQNNIVRHLGTMTARFLSAQDQDEIVSILAQQARLMDIAHVAIAFYVPDEQDPVAWSMLYASDEAHSQVKRFPSREFPPPGLYSENRLHHLALLPLVIAGSTEGFVGLDASNIAHLEPGASIVRQLASAILCERMYREAVKGQHLAEEANQLKSRLLSTVSHELRTPLSLIVGQSQLLLQQAAQQADQALPYQQDLERIYASAQHLDSLIRDVLDLARSGAGALKLVCKALDLREVFSAITMVGEQLAHDKGLQWHISFPDQLPKVWGDPIRLRQVMLNLVNNAIKFTDQGEVCLEVKVVERGVRVSVSDTGLGIPLEDQAAIFDEFHQSERTTARGYGGLGLGLAICKRLVEMHGGEIGVLSSGKEGAGSVFHFTLPIFVSSEALEATQFALLSPEQTVLLMAQRTKAGERLHEYLQRQGFTVHAIWAGEVSSWPTQQLLAPVSAVVLDVQIAAAHGWEILSILRERPPTQNAPAILYSLEEDLEAGAVLPVNYLAKPLDRTELATALENQGLLVEEGQEETTILIVDDDPNILELHAHTVQLLPGTYRVLKAHNGREALSTMREVHPKLILLDLMMPELDGFGVLEAMQADEALRHIPVIVSTAQALSEADLARLNQGVTSILGKRLFTETETLEHIKTALERSKKLGTETQRLVRKALAFLHEHYTEPISLETTAEHIHVSKQYLARCFPQEMGITLVNYLNRYRVNQAKILLEVEEKTITNVALEVGFSSSSYFSRVFRQETGMSPSEYRQALQI